MPLLGMAAGHPEEACDRVCGDVAQAGGGTHPTPFTHMINDGLGVFLGDLRSEERGAPSLRELCAAGATTEEPDAVVAIDVAHGEMALAREAKPLAFTVHTR